MPFVTNTTVISNFAAIGYLDLVQRALTTCHLPEQVYAEIQAGYLQGYLFYEGINRMITPFVPDGWLHLVSLQTPSEFEMFGALHGQLHHGEAACLALAHHRNWVFLTDDRAARNTARRLQIRVSGSIGIFADPRGTKRLKYRGCGWNFERLV